MNPPQVHHASDCEAQRTFAGRCTCGAGLAQDDGGNRAPKETIPPPRVARIRHATTCPLADPGAARRLREAGQPVAGVCTCGATERTLAEALVPGVQRIQEAAHQLADRIALGTALHGLLGLEGVETVVLTQRGLRVRYEHCWLPAEAEEGELIGDVAVATLAVLRGERDWPWPEAECPRPPRVQPCTCPVPRLRPGHLPGCPAALFRYSIVDGQDATIASVMARGKRHALDVWAQQQGYPELASHPQVKHLHLRAILEPDPTC